MRDWALAVFAGGADPAPAAPREAWRVFLAVERCALPLRARVLARRARLSSDAAAVLEARANAELVRALSARARLITLGRMVSRLGTGAVALKGGAAALGTDPLDVQDVDVLVRPEHAEAVAAGLEAGAGARRLGAEAAPGTAGTFHLAPRGADDAVPVEVHYALPFVGDADPWAEAVPAGPPGILRLAPALHLWHVLVHGAVHHPERRGSLRELLMTAGAVAACDAGELAEVRARAAAHPDAPPLLRTLDVAESLARGVPAADAFRPLGALGYLFAASGGGRAYRGALGIYTMRAAYALATAEGAYRRLWLSSPSGVRSLEKFGGASWVDRLIPAAGHTLRVAYRGACTVAGTLRALRLARAARALAAEAPRG
ncbi:nucleotidyltransferase family protein [Longimicrobium sp.]|uniref:nucleotidyltransferase family protein n=1 Tax=Longimicrobium sp. TaxID=2029185 RepID=UPI002E33A70C|nr:nucleotidyltransferase family protein [Longimicrobium sp.]HEX6040103.1 nucleotidyltransferase family protein [Longimicrobium sp.]